MTKSLNNRSADDAGAELGGLVVAELVAAAEALIPGKVRVRSVYFARPIPSRLELVFQVGEEERLLAARRQLAADFRGPTLGAFQRHALGLSGQQDQVIARLAILAEDDSGVVLTGLQLDFDFGESDQRRGRLRFEFCDHRGKFGLPSLDHIDSDGHYWHLLKWLMKLL